jgi:aspartate kinase
MKSNPGVAATMFKALSDEGVNIEMISTSEIKIACIISENDVEKAVRKLHQVFIEKE